MGGMLMRVNARHYRYPGRTTTEFASPALNCLPPPGTPGAGIPRRLIHRCRRSDV
jgi:hypothetical protein